MYTCLFSQWFYIIFVPKVPEILKPWMPEQYQELIPFVKPAPIDLEAAAAAKKGKKQKEDKK